LPSARPTITQGHNRFEDAEVLASLVEGVNIQPSFEIPSFLTSKSEQGESK
jgi:hypothetical protein